MLFSFPLFSHSLFFVPYSLKPALVSRNLGLTSAVSSPPSGSERSPAAKHIKCIILCICMFNGCAKTVII